MMPAKSGRWADLRPRLISALVMIVVALLAIWAGGMVFALVIALCCGGMLWELTQMLAPRREETSLAIGAVGVGSVLVAALLPAILAFVVLLAPVALAWKLIPVEARKRFVLFSLWIMLAGYAFVWMRCELGPIWLLWLAIVVVLTDVAGYFAGKIFGGPKFWPRISPKKTWSGTSAGWVAAALVGAGFAAEFHLGFGFVLASVLISMASQAGDVAESALKRQTGVKDSSALIPGHGGLLDRFDGMLGAAAMFLLLFVILG
ncbi:phosphatidate cytidylyltransferase [Roseobacter sp. SK209-2-6]|uniref:phosphatidate cytidylyltransferase n=1 Tax=Roseobacter sp. SK209-2-6 TaxID=388739 RepID=UPI0000F3F5FE|nr:phosphatidate cytidylyltransferase [Roseobacter sp. SK209-2-6]